MLLESQRLALNTNLSMTCVTIRQLSTSPTLSMSSASHSAGSSGWLAQKTGAGPTFQWAGKVDAICRSRSNRAKRPRAGCILRS